MAACGGHLEALDGLRGVAILAVLVSHFGRFQPLGAAEAWLQAALSSGWAGVDLFFVLSGFLITGILYRTRGGEGYLRNFYARRALRIFPLYFFFIGACVLLLPLLLEGDPKVGVLLQNQAWFWTYTSNFLMAFQGIAATPLYTFSMWSLAVEEQFYLVWPFCVLLLDRRRLMHLCGVMIAGALVIRTGLVLEGAALAAYVLPFARMDALAVGAWLALAAHGPGGLSSLATHARPIALTAAAILLAAFLSQQGLGNLDVFMQTIGYSLLAILFGAVLLLAVASPGGTLIERVGRNGVLRFFGRYSYGLYVLHNPVRLALLSAGLHPKVAAIPGESQLPGAALFFVLGMSGSVVAALVSWHLLEQPLLRLKRRFEYTAPAAPPGRTVAAAEGEPAL